jgi:hypothetical protein
MSVNRICVAVSAGLALACATAAPAVFVGATEGFDSGPANWSNAANNAFLDWFASGGPDGSAYASGLFDFSATAVGDTPVILRARGANNASGGIFTGDWIAAGITELRFSIRHDGPAPVTIFTRFANPANTPGATAISFVPVFSNTWTEVSVLISPMNPAFVTFEGSDFNTIFSNIGNLQFGVSVDETLAGLSTPVRFDIDNVRVVPAPAGLALFGVFCAGSLQRRRFTSR